MQSALKDVQHQRELVEQEQATLRDSSVRISVFVANMTAYAEAIQEHRKILDPYRGQDVSLLQHEVDSLKQELAKLEVCASYLQPVQVALCSNGAAATSDITRIGASSIQSIRARYQRERSSNCSAKRQRQDYGI
jgi:hypothetical protein